MDGEGDGDGLDEHLQALARSVLGAAEIAKIGIAVNVHDGPTIRRLYVSDVAARILGYSREELIGNPTLQSFPPEEAERLAAIGRKFAEDGGGAGMVESVVVRKDGVRTPVEVAYTGVELEGKRAAVSFITDITERKRTEEALKKSERIFRQLIEAAPDAIAVSSGGRVVYANPRLLELIGCATLEELAASPPTSFVHPDDRSGIASRQEGRRRAESLPTAEFRLVRPDGRVVSVESSSLTLEFEGAPAILTILRDVTTRKELQAQLMQHDRLATIGTLAAAVGHELNNPLAYVTLNIELLEREIRDMGQRPSEHDTARIREKLRMLREGANRIAAVVQDLRTFCRPAGPPRPTDPLAVLESAIEMAKNEIDGRARIVRDYSPVPLVLADSTRLGQVFLNLLVNAGQAIAASRRSDREGGHELSVALGLQGSDRVKVEVTDSGDGIAPEVIGRIFDPFFTTKPPGMGTGLGLSISKSIVTAMNGELVVKSDVGTGTTFVVLLPALQ
jgi:PAS domain S-box-containing protein